ncbi:KinB-signaling pathway activation protein [Paenibacillus sp. CC-CFT747]|nr:KinB-signaling pathway activation protein [Paenibacillus sp. CC-CFT747]
MIIRFIAMGILRSRVRWDLLQLAVVIVVMIDTVYLRYSTFASNESWVGYALLPVLILLFALAISWWKVKLTNGGAFLSTLFFMFVATILEAVPALNLDSPPSYIFMLVPLLVCNAWQILILQKVLDNKKEPEAGSLAPHVPSGANSNF